MTPCCALAFHCWGPGSTLGYVMWDLWWIEWHLELVNSYSTNRSILINHPIIIIIIIIMAVQPFVGPWPLFLFLDYVHSR
jgi:hypothetical protein